MRIRYGAVIAFLGTLLFTPASQAISPSYETALGLVHAAHERTKQRVRYDGRYIPLSFPWGDVPNNIGVCSDVVIRAYRALGVDLQALVNDDISKNFFAYPSFSYWNLLKPDPSIDHRRVLNLQVFFARAGQSLPMTMNPMDYRPGDLVTWMVGSSQPHIGIVTDVLAENGVTPLIVHNIGAGPVYEDILFNFPMTGHFRYLPISSI